MNTINNYNRLDIKGAITNLSIPHLIIHGSEDSTVLIYEAKKMKKWNIKSELHIIDGADHVFGGFHPYNLECFPKHLNQAVILTHDFLKR